MEYVIIALQFILSLSIEKDAVVYMGKDKYENEELIKYALPHDIW